MSSDRLAAAQNGALAMTMAALAKPTDIRAHSTTAIAHSLEELGTIATTIAAHVEGHPDAGLADAHAAIGAARCSLIRARALIATPIDSPALAHVPKTTPTVGDDPSKRVELSVEQVDTLTDRALLREALSVLRGLVMMIDHGVKPVATLADARAVIAKAEKVIG